VLQRATYNLLLRSEDFTTTWSTINTSVTSNTIVAPDGALTGDKLVENTATASHSTAQFVAVTSGTTYTFSCFVKRAERSWVVLRLLGAFADTTAYFDLSTGVVGFTSGGTASITNAGNGWYRCIFTLAASSTANGECRVGIASANATQAYTGDGTSGIFIWGAQLEAASTAGPYYATTTAANGAPRFTYNPATLAADGLLIEEQRTNLLLRSAELATSPWFNANLTSIANNTNEVIAPDGTNSATKIVATGSSSSVGQGATLTAVVHTGSIWLRCSSGTVSAQLVVYLAASPFTNIGTANVTITTSWQRFTVTTSAATAAAYNLQVNNIGAGTVYAWGAQLEAGAFPTSYIATVASQATRAADSASMTGTNFSSWYNASEGTIYVDAQTNITYAGTNQFPYKLQIDDGTANNRIISLARVLSSYTDQTYAIQVGGVNQAVFDTNTNNGNSKAAIAYKINDFAFAVAGTLQNTDTSGSVPTVNRMLLGNQSGSGNWLNGTIRKIAFYPQRVTNAQLQALTR
jgi:hypothetical protein